MSENMIQPIDPPEMIQQLAQATGGTIDECALLPDGSGFATMSMPLPKNHWLTADDGTFEAPPMSLRDAWVHAHGPYREMMRRALADKIRVAAKYAIRASTMKGKEEDFDPDAMVQNFVVGLLGYWTADGLTDDQWANPPHLRNEPPRTADVVGEAVE